MKTLSPTNGCVDKVVTMALSVGMSTRKEKTAWAPLERQALLGEGELASLRDESHDRLSNIEWSVLKKIYTQATKMVQQVVFIDVCIHIHTYVTLRIKE